LTDADSMEVTRAARLPAFLTLLLVVVTAAVLEIASPSSAAGGAFYVDRTVTGCSDTGLGSAGAPFCTITKGVGVLHAGDTLYIGDGTYPETLKPLVSGTATDPVTVTRWPGRSPTITGASTYGASVSSKSYIVLSNLTFTGTVIDGIYVSSSNHVTITGNTVTAAGQPRQGATAPGISLRSTSVSTVSGNTSDHNSSHGIYVSGTSTDNTVEGNAASFNAEGWRRNANGIDVIAAGNTILRNVVHDNEDSGLQFYSGGDNNLATLNVTYNNGDHGIDNFNVTGGRLIGNTVYRNCTSGINVEGTSGNYVVANNVAVDNAVYPAYGGISCSRRAGNIGIWDSAPATTTVDHNLVHLSRPGTMYVFNRSYTSLAPMQSDTGQEGAGVQADPRFADPASWDLRLTAGSPAIDRGDSGVAGEQGQDLLTNPRVDDSATPNSLAGGPRPYDDLGAYELQVGSAAPSAPTARLSVTPATGSAPLQTSADASASSDPQGQALTYTFDFGDGTPTTGPQTGPTTTHTYTKAGTYTLTVTATASGALTNSATQTVTVNGTASAPPSFVSAIANNNSTSTKTSGYITVWRTAGVAAGDLVVLTLQLSGTSPSGTVTATDAAGNTYTQSASVSDAAGNRLVLVSGVATRALAVNDRITATFPTATTYRLGGDEFTGATRLDQSTTATGTTSTFSSGTAQATTGNGIAFGAVSIPAGTTTPGWATGWRDLGSAAVGNRYLGRAYQFPVSGGYAATGTASGPWLATVATFAR
jgi:parallel beta-helix repeat protein